MITLNVKLEFKETLKMNFNVAYRKPLIIFLTILGFGMNYVVINYLTINNLGLESFPTYQTVFGLYCVIGLPLTIIFNTKKTLKNNKFISQHIEYQFDSKTITINGETFNMNMPWTDLTMTKELEQWFLLYTSKSQALFIPKNRFANSKDLIDFKGFISNLKK